MQHIEVKRRFDAPVERVWAVYSDHARWSEWAGVGRSWLESVGSPERDGTGCVRALATAGVAAYEEVLDWQPPQRFTYTVRRGGLPMKNHLGEVILEPDGEGTLLTWRCRFESAVPGLGWLLAIVVRRFFTGALAGLARRL